MRLTTKLNGITAVASGQTAQVEIQRDRRLHSILLFSGSDAAAVIGYKIKEFRLLVGGAQILRLTPAQLFALNAYRGIPFANGEILIPFSDSAVRTPVGEESSSLNLFLVNSTVILEVEYYSDAEYNTLASTSGGFTPSLSGLMEYDFVNDGNRVFNKRTPITIPVSASGEFDHGTLPRIGAYRAIHLFSSNVTRARVRRDGVEVLDRNVASVAAIGRRNGLTPQSGHFPIDFAPTNQATDALEMVVALPDGGARIVNEFNVKLDVSAGGNITGVLEHFVAL